MASKTPRSDVLAGWLARQRWFAAKTRQVVAVEIDDRVPIAPAELLLASIRLDDGTTDRYAIPVLVAGADGTASSAHDGPETGRVHARDAGDDGGHVADALDDPRFGLALLALVRAGGRADGERGAVVGVPTRAFPSLPSAPAVRRLGGEQSNTSVAVGDQLILKHFRRLTAGPNPEEEMGRFLAERTSFANTPRLAGHLEYRERDGSTSTLVVVHEMIPGARDGWAWTLDELGRVFEQARHAGEPSSGAIARIGDRTLAAFRRLGEVTAALHRALGGDRRDAAFAPEPISPADVTAWSAAIERQVRDARALLPGGLPSIPHVSDGLAALVGRHKSRHHGDFHLGQTLHRPSDGDFLIIDFEGEPLRPIAERRRKHTPLRDVAGMLRSIDYAAVSAMPAGLESWARAWRSAAETEFIDAYRARTAGAAFVPDGDDAFRRTVAVFELEKAAYEVVYEANHRPDWVRIPVAGLARAASALGAAGHAGAA